MLTLFSPGSEKFVSHFFKIVALIFRVDSEYAKKVFGKNPTFLRFVQYLGKGANFEKYLLGPKLKLFTSRFQNTP